MPVPPSVRFAAQRKELCRAAIRQALKGWQKRGGLIMGRLKTGPLHPPHLAWILCSSLLAGCGSDGSGGSDVSGSWRGQLFQASGINCSDGSFIGAGLGTPTRVIAVQVTGGEVTGAEAALSLDACMMTGSRVTSSSMIFVSAAPACPREIWFSGINGGVATLHLNPGRPEANSDGTVSCVIEESGTVALG